MSAGEQPGRVFVGEAPAQQHRRQDSINVDQRISSYIFDVIDGRNNATVAVIKQADLLRKVHIPLCDSNSLLEKLFLPFFPPVFPHKFPSQFPPAKYL